MKNEVLKIDNYIIDDLEELSVWVGYRVCEAESVEIFEELWYHIYPYEHADEQGAWI